MVMDRITKSLSMLREFCKRLAKPQQQPHQQQPHQQQPPQQPHQQLLQQILLELPFKIICLG
jgi:hypothetical protein